MGGMKADIILEVRRLTLSFGGVKALSLIDLEVSRGEIFAVIGPNGAGKTSLFNCISGVYKPQSGKIMFKEAEVSSLNPHVRAKMGIGRTFQHVELFRGMSVLDNIKLGRHHHIRAGFFGSVFRAGRAVVGELDGRRYLEEKVLDFLDLSAVRWTPVGLLPQGLQKRVDLGRALALQPEMLLMDEPMAGMSTEEKEEMASFMMDVHRDLGVTIVWIEHDLKTVMDISNRVCVLNFGQKIAEGSFHEIRTHQAVKEAYLGLEDEQ